MFRMSLAMDPVIVSVLTSMRSSMYLYSWSASVDSPVCLLIVLISSAKAADALIPSQVAFVRSFIALIARLMPCAARFASAPFMTVKPSELFFTSSPVFSA